MYKFSWASEHTHWCWRRNIRTNDLAAHNASQKGSKVRSVIISPCCGLTKGIIKSVSLTRVQMKLLLALFKGNIKNQDFLIVNFYNIIYYHNIKVSFVIVLLSVTWNHSKPFKFLEKTLFLKLSLPFLPGNKKMQSKISRIHYFLPHYGRWIRKGHIQFTNATIS